MKLIEWVLDKWVSGIEAHDCLRGCWTKHGYRTGIIESKLVQQLTFINQTPIYNIFVDLHKAYTVIDRRRCVDILVEARVRPKGVRVIMNFWEGGILY